MENLPTRPGIARSSLPQAAVHDRDLGLRRIRDARPGLRACLQAAIAVAVSVLVQVSASGAEPSRGPGAEPTGRAGMAPAFVSPRDASAFGAVTAPRQSGVSPNCRWATGVVDFSSEWSPTGWSARQALGPPDTYSAHGDISSAWASAMPDSPREFLVLSYDDPAPINYVNVYETWYPGAIDRISVKNPGTGLFETVWTGTAAAAPPVSRVFTATFPETPFAVSEVRIELDSQAVTTWNEIDAVSIGLCDYDGQSQWVASVVDFSSQYSATDWSAQQTVGPPDTYPNHGPTDWASLTADGQREFLVLAYDTPTVINFVNVYETFAPGTIDTVLVKNPDTGLFETVWADTAAPVPGGARIFTASFPVTQFPVSEVRLAINSPAVGSWNEIDAIGIGRCVCSDRLVDVSGGEPAPTVGVLAAPRPNPFHGSTEIGFSLPREGHVRIEVFNTLGQRVTRLLDRAMPGGRHAVRWAGLDEGGRAAPSGIYYVMADADGLRQTRRIVKIR
jgi:hypothetical protein